MDRQEVIEQIFSLKSKAIKEGFDWPTNDSTENVTTEVLAEFLEELKDFFEQTY